jgi:RNA polymerase sigma-70 factor (ECF subfamily)
MTEEIGLFLSPATKSLPGEGGLLASCQHGDLAAFETLYSTHASRMKSIAFQMLSDRRDAEDAVQEAFLRIYRGCGGLDRESGFVPWMYRVLLNCCYDTGRKRQKQAESEMVSEPASSTQVPIQVALRHALSRIHSGYRTVFWLFEAEGFRHSEIAAILEIPEGTSRKWLFEAKRELKRLLMGTRP